MKEAYKGEEFPEWMSTHPSSLRRIESLKKWIPEIIMEYPPIKKIS
jgi:Zn-dependent protease with chaperone function